ncbi:MAG: GNAT family N-acetyltransferase [Planctomycetota bacterium]|nr:GNAT family N-acetyltransferase [Planctomycetota bacterium]
MADDLEYGPARANGEKDAVAEILCGAFNTTVEECGEWIDRAGIDQLRVIRPGGRVGGCLVLIPMGQWFGGRSVPMTGIAGVAIAPEHRGNRGAGGLMSSMLAEMYEKGQFLSTLYASTQPLYRRAGYEQAGTTFDILLATSQIDIRDRDLSVRPIGPEDDPAVAACYRQWAMRHDGSLDRRDYIWRRIRTPRKNTARGYLVEGPSGVEGFLYYMQVEAKGGRYSLKLTDVTSVTRSAARRLLTFLADHRSMAFRVQWQGGPADTLLTMLREQRSRMRLWEYWMLRIVDVAGALEARGYAADRGARVHFEVRDDVLPQNNGRFVLEVSDGRGKVSRGGDGRVGIDVRGLAAMYTGHWTAEQLRGRDYLEASAEDASAASAVFAGHAPFMSDRF